MPQSQIPLIKGDKTGSETDYRDGLPINMYAVQKNILGAAGYMQNYSGIKTFYDVPGQYNYLDRFDGQGGIISHVPQRGTGSYEAAADYSVVNGAVSIPPGSASVGYNGVISSPRRIELQVTWQGSGSSVIDVSIKIGFVGNISTAIPPTFGDDGYSFHFRSFPAISQPPKCTIYDLSDKSILGVVPTPTVVELAESTFLVVKSDGNYTIKIDDTELIVFPDTTDINGNIVITSSETPTVSQNLLWRFAAAEYI